MVSYRIAGQSDSSATCDREFLKISNDGWRKNALTAVFKDKSGNQGVDSLEKHVFLFPKKNVKPILDHSRSLGSLGCLEGLLQKPNVPKPVCFEVRGMSRIPALRFGRKGLVATKNDDDLSRSTTVSWRKYRKRTEDRSVLVLQVKFKVWQDALLLGSWLLYLHWVRNRLITNQEGRLFDHSTDGHVGCNSPRLEDDRYDRELLSRSSPGVSDQKLQEKHIKQHLYIFYIYILYNLTTSYYYILLETRLNHGAKVLSKPPTKWAWDHLAVAANLLWDGFGPYSPHTIQDHQKIDIKYGFIRFPPGAGHEDEGLHF